MQIRVSILGAGGSYPPPGYAGPCILVRTARDHILIDPGESCLSRLTITGMDPCGIENVYISHAHIDHWSGLPGIVVARTARKCDGDLKVTIPWVDEGLPDVLVRMESRGYITIKRSVPNLGDLEMEPVPVMHTVATYGLKAVRQNKTLLFYTADTMYSEQLIEKARNSHLLITEATLPDRIDPETAGMHMRVRDVIELTAKAKPRLLAIVHLSPESLAQIEETIFPSGPAVMYGEGYTITIG